MLSVEFQRFEASDPPRATFTTAITRACAQIRDLKVWDSFHVLEWLLKNYWSHPTLVCMMKGEEIDKDTGRSKRQVRVKNEIERECHDNYDYHQTKNLSDMIFLVRSMSNHYEFMYKSENILLTALFKLSMPIYSHN